MITFGIWLFIALVILLIFSSLIMKIVAVVFNWKVIAIGASLVFLWKKFRK